MMRDIFPITCNEEIHKNGHTVFSIKHLDTKRIENWVNKISEKSGQKLDWYYGLGVACVLALGDLDKVRKTIKEGLPELNELIYEYKKEKWGISFKEYDTFKYTEKDVDYWNKPEKDTYRGMGLKFTTEDLS